MATPQLSPLNDLAFLVTLKVMGPTGAMIPLDTGSASCFLATSAAATAGAADPSLVGTITYTGAGGKWTVSFDAAILTPSLLATHFAAATPYVIIQVANGIRRAVACQYSDSYEAEVS